ncbi:MAG: hypothetical protein JSS72_02615 [Armatimonadetes bacterium]|nr:hypothetical protein [Armatimonadota bacterium]
MNPKLLEILACPRCESRPPLAQESDEMLKCTECGYRYRIVDGIPDLLPEDGIAPDAPTDTK